MEEAETQAAPDRTHYTTNCPNCGAIVSPAVDSECWRCLTSFLAPDYWDFLR